MPHYGVVLPWQEFQNFSKLLKLKNAQFIIEPYIRFVGEVGEQATMFFLDPVGNALKILINFLLYKKTTPLIFLQVKGAESC